MRCFSLQQAEGKLAGDGEGRGLDAGLIAILDLVDLGLEAFALGPAQIHAHQHLGPVLRLGAARAGVHGDDGVERVVLFGEHGARLELFGVGVERFDLAAQIVLDRALAFAHEFEVRINIAHAAAQLGVVPELLFESLTFAHQRL